MPVWLRKRPIFLGVLAAALLAAPGLVAQARAASGKYVNPFADTNWQVSRTDMGVDWVPLRPLPVRAIGDALILGADSHASWPGHHIIWYQLLGGGHAGEIIYVAEHLIKMVPAGRTVHAGQRIAVAMPGYPWIEMGWATPYGSPRAYPCYHEGKATNSGREMARFLQHLGAPVGDPPGRGPDRPVGTLC